MTGVVCRREDRRIVRRSTATEAGQREAMVGCGNRIFNGLEISRDRADAKAPIRIDKACRGVQKLHKVYKLSWLLGRHSKLFWSANKAHKAVHIVIYD